MRLCKNNNNENFIKRLFRKTSQNKRSFILYIILCSITVAAICYSVIIQNWVGVFNGVMTLLLFLLPPFLEETLKIEISAAMEVLAMLFIFASQVLGEVAKFYTRFWFWDDLLHAVNGLLFAAFGFALTDLMNRKRNICGRFSPFFLAMVACCFSLSIGVFWEFFEFLNDYLVRGDMQKDHLLATIASGQFSADGQTPVVIRNIVRTTIETGDGKIYTIERGYLDLGLYDTMKDLAVDFLGALLGSIPGYFYLRKREKEREEETLNKKMHPAQKVGNFAMEIAGSLIPVVPKLEEAVTVKDDSTDK